MADSKSTTIVACACGCGELFDSRVIPWRVKRFVVGHAARGKPGYRKPTTTTYLERGRKRIHVLVAEKALGKPLPKGADVHHVDGNKWNNANSNLVICQDRAYHGLLHKRARVLRAGGDPNTQRICCHCKRLLPMEMLNGTGQNQCQPCVTARCREKRQALARLRKANEEA
jgi:hypothetical protein